VRDVERRELAMNAPLKSTGWTPKRYGSKDDPIRQSDLTQLASSYGCGKRFEFRKLEEGSGVAPTRKRVYGAQLIGTATHEVLRRILTAAPDAVLAGRKPTEQRVREALLEEMAREAGDLPVDWKKAKPDSELRAAIAMVRGALEAVPQYFRSILVVEEPFLVAIDCGGKEPVWAQGTIDLAGELHADGRLVNGVRLDGGIGLADWKTGATRPHRIVLDHGYQGGIYGRALADGVLSPGTESERKGPGYPSTFFLVHLRDYVPYSRASRRRISDDDAAWLNREPGELVPFKAGDQRGPGWYPSKRTELDDRRLRKSIQTLVGTVRLGRFVETIDDHCVTCPYRDRCLAETVDDASANAAINRVLDDDAPTGFEGIDAA